MFFHCDCNDSMNSRLLTRDERRIPQTRDSIGHKTHTSWRQTSSYSTSNDHKSPDNDKIPTTSIHSTGYHRLVHHQKGRHVGEAIEEKVIASPTTRRPSFESKTAIRLVVVFLLVTTEVFTALPLLQTCFHLLLLLGCEECCELSCGRKPAHVGSLN